MARDLAPEVLVLYLHIFLRLQLCESYPWRGGTNIYTNKTGDCLSVCLFICLSICSAMGGQTERPSGLKFGG